MLSMILKFKLAEEKKMNDLQTNSKKLSLNYRARIIYFGTNNTAYLKDGL